jgi:hypothetical protein
MGYVLPVGTPGGLVSGLRGLSAGTGIARLGEEMLHLDADGYRLWRLAAAAPEHDQFINWAIANGYPSAVGTLQNLRDIGLVIESSADPRLQARSLSLRLIGECLGNGYDATSPLRVKGSEQKDPLAVNLIVYEVLIRSDGQRTIASYCDLLEDAQPSFGVGTAAHEVFAQLPILVRAGVARLDRATR